MLGVAGVARVAGVAGVARVADHNFRGVARENGWGGNIFDRGGRGG